MAREAAIRPSACSIVAESGHSWRDDAWMTARGGQDPLRRPISIYEVHLGTWRRRQDGMQLELPYADLALQLAEYVAELGFTHVELMPLTAHPFPGSWGYQTTSYYAPDPRHGKPDELRVLIDTMHQHGVGVLLDWVPGHFCPDDWALARFDGTATYEHPDPRRGTQPMWGSLVFDHGRPEVRSFLLSSARYWLSEYHVDGLRIDAVASMLRHDWGRAPDQVLANEDGSLDNHQGESFLRELTAMVCEEAPGAITIAEEATGAEGMTGPEGVGFTFRWNMGWGHDWLKYFGSPPERKASAHNDITFASSYADTDQFILSLSHDDADAESLLAQMWGGPEQRAAGLRALLALQWAHRGKKLLFMGGEFAQQSPWTHHDTLDWRWLDDSAPNVHSATHALVAALGAHYRSDPALWSLDDDGSSMVWLVADDRERSAYAFVRVGSGGEMLLCVANLGVANLTRYELDVYDGDRWEVVIDTDSEEFGGAGCTTVSGQSEMLTLDLAPLTCIWLTNRSARR
jgi:1,4-alpha-glucan branching enzyme